MWSSPGEYMELYEKLIDWERAEQTGVGSRYCSLPAMACISGLSGNISTFIA